MGRRGLFFGLLTFLQIADHSFQEAHVLKLRLSRAIFTLSFVFNALTTLTFQLPFTRLFLQKIGGGLSHEDLILECLDTFLTHLLV